ncbi:hypothetical protein K4K54_011304 [Colletotrichum sp. SAR 10_86]|nr:hypothetical protein K4K54_011304 [Colletotrichum sp. SAR 10_86]
MTQRPIFKDVASGLVELKLDNMRARFRRGDLTSLQFPLPSGELRVDDEFGGHIVLSSDTSSPLPEGKQYLHDSLQARSDALQDTIRIRSIEFMLSLHNFLDQELLRLGAGYPPRPRSLHDPSWLDEKGPQQELGDADSFDGMMKDVQNGGKVVAMAKAWEVRLQKELPRLRDFQRSVPENAGQPEDPVNVGRRLAKINIDSEYHYPGQKSPAEKMKSPKVKTSANNTGGPRQVHFKKGSSHSSGSSFPITQGPDTSTTSTTSTASTAPASDNHEDEEPVPGVFLHTSSNPSASVNLGYNFPPSTPFGQVPPQPTYGPFIPQTSTHPAFAAEANAFAPFGKFNPFGLQAPAYVNMADYQNVAPPAGGLHFQPPVPDTSHGVMQHVYVPRFDNGAPPHPGYAYHQPPPNNVTYIGQAPPPNPPVMIAQQPIMQPGMAMQNPPIMLQGPPQVMNGAPMFQGPPPMGMNIPPNMGGGGGPVFAGNGGFPPDVTGFGKTAGEIAMEQAQFAYANGLFEPQDFKPADDDPSRYYPVREVDGNWTQRNRFTIDNLGDCRWYVAAAMTVKGRSSTLCEWALGVSVEEYCDSVQRRRRKTSTGRQRISVEISTDEESEEDTVKITYPRAGSKTSAARSSNTKKVRFQGAPKPALKTADSDAESSGDSEPDPDCKCRDCKIGRRRLRKAGKGDKEKVAKAETSEEESKANGKNQSKVDKKSNKVIESSSESDDSDAETIETDTETEDEVPPPPKKTKDKKESKKSKKNANKSKETAAGDLEPNNVGPTKKERAKKSDDTKKEKAKKAREPEKLRPEAALSPNLRRPNLIMPIRAEVLQVEHAIEGVKDPRPNAFHDSQHGVVRVYHGPAYGNPYGLLYPARDPSKATLPLGMPHPLQNPYFNGFSNTMNPGDNHSKSQSPWGAIPVTYMPGGPPMMAPVDPMQMPQIPPYWAPVSPVKIFSVKGSPKMSGANQAGDSKEKGWDTNVGPAGAKAPSPAKNAKVQPLNNNVAPASPINISLTVNPNTPWAEFANTVSKKSSPNKDGSQAGSKQGSNNGSKKSWGSKKTTDWQTIPSGQHPDLGWGTPAKSQAGSNSGWPQTTGSWDNNAGPSTNSPVGNASNKSNGSKKSSRKGSNNDDAWNAGSGDNNPAWTVDNNTGPMTVSPNASQTSKKSEKSDKNATTAGEGGGWGPAPAGDGWNPTGTEMSKGSGSSKSMPGAWDPTPPWGDTSMAQSTNGLAETW